MNNLCPIVVLIGGSGSNLQALIDHKEAGKSYQIVGVVSHRPQAFGLQRAKNAGIPTLVVDHTTYTSRDTFEAALQQAVLSFQPQFAVLAGFMRVLSGAFIEQLARPILNIHPSLLPKYKGLHTHARVLADGETEHGVSIHFVTQDLDGGPIIAQSKVAVYKNDDEATLAARVLTVEHWLYPQVVSWLAQNRLKYDQNAVTVDGKEVSKQGMQLTSPTVQGIVS